MYNAIILEDELKIQLLIELKVNKLAPDVSIVDKVSTVQDAITSIEKHHPNIIFLDVHLLGESGFDLLEYFDHINFQVIFITGSNDYVLKALKSNAIDYVLKPVSDDLLISAINKAKMKIKEGINLQDYKMLIEKMKIIEPLKRIAVSCKNGYEFVQVENIIRCEGDQKYTKIFLENGRTLLSCQNLGIYKNKLSERFFLCHKSHLVNGSKIQKYIKDGFVILTDGVKIPVAKRRKEAFLRFLHLH